jgi:hypothetical protein
MEAGDTWTGTAAIAIFVCLLYRYAIYPACLSPLASVPNAHWSVPFSRLWILRVRFVHWENRTLHAAHRRLGPIIRVGPNELSINDLGSVRSVYQGGYEKPVWYSVFDNYGYDTGSARGVRGTFAHIPTMPEVSRACFRPAPPPNIRHESG